MCLEIPWRNELPSLNILLSSHVWRQDHNGFTHQDPGFIGHLATKRPEIVRIYLPPDANCLLSVMHHCLKSRHYINVITAGKHASPQSPIKIPIYRTILRKPTSFSLVTELNQIYKQRIKTRDELVKSNTPVLHKSHFYVSRVQT